MKLSEILCGVETVDDRLPDTEVTDLELDSRQVSNGAMFIALSGKTQDGKKYIPSALEKGARVIVYDGEYDDKWLFGDPIVIDSTLKVSYEEVGDYDVDVYGHILDVYGNDYYTETLSLTFE